jgi:hypothetical protein
MQASPHHGVRHCYHLIEIPLILYHWLLLMNGHANKKAMLANAGAAGGINKDWKPFPLREVQQFLAL